jgi:cardiolipin synthase
VKQLQEVYAADWYWVTGEILELDWRPEKVADPGMDVLPLATGPVTEVEDCSIMFLEAITSARERIWISSPYFVPGADIEHALQMAVLRGVDVRLLLPQRADHAVVWLAGLYFAEAMVSSGVKVYQYTEGFLHQKAFLVDESWAAVGTANLDNRSFRLNFEISLIVFDELFSKSVEKMFVRDFERSEILTTEDYARLGWGVRIGSHVARLFGPIL